MSDADTLTSPCPHCGYPSEDSELCRACGRLMDEGFQVKPFSISETFNAASVKGEKASRMDWACVADPEIDDKQRTHPSYAYNPGNIFYDSEG